MRKILIVWLAILATGCASISGLLEAFKCKKTRAELSPDIGKMAIEKVVVLPLINNTEYPDAGRLVTKALCTEMKKLSKFKVLQISESELVERLFPGSVMRPEEPNPREAEIVAAAHEADAVVMGNVTRYMPYPPMVVGISVKMIHARTGKVVWSVDEVYDGSLREVMNLSKQYCAKMEKTTEPVHDWRKPFVSIRYFTQFVCYEVARTLKL